MNKVALVIIYNHQYNKNIDQLEVMYGSRFSHIYHLVPFYNGDKPKVIAVYDSSYFFQGYVAQGLKGYFSNDFDHYFFIGDDLVLNPVINEHNYREHLKLEPESSFIPRLSPLAEDKNYWPNNITALLYNMHAPGVEAAQQLPDRETALAKMKQFGITQAPMEFYQVWKTPAKASQWIGLIYNDPKLIGRFLISKLKKKKYQTGFPMVRSYSDIFVVDRSSIKQFCHYCGVFAATKLFVELALPTALVLSAGKIITEKDIAFSGRALWTASDHEILDKYEFNLDALLADFPAAHLYLHPIKLSKWKRK